MKNRIALAVAIVLVLALASCKRPKAIQLIEGYTYAPEGFHYHLVSFTDGKLSPKKGETIWLDAEFRTQKDSVFWDSHHDMRNRFFFTLRDSTDQNGFLKHLYRMTEGDSMTFYFRTAPFYRSYFKTDSIPFFSRNDTVVEARIRLRHVMNEKEFERLSNDLETVEKREIEAYLIANQETECADSLGIKWLAYEAGSGAAAEPGKTVVISYKGYFLDGKLIDYSAGNFSYSYGTPDQLIKGLNSVIGRMKEGDFVKIILSSWLAFGKTGSSNGTIPPFTPLLYEIKLTEVK